MDCVKQINQNQGWNQMKFQGLEIYHFFLFLTSLPVRYSGNISYHIIFSLNNTIQGRDMAAKLAIWSRRLYWNCVEIDAKTDKYYEINK